MTKNMGLIDKIVRVLVALLVVLLYMNNIIEGTLAIILLIFAAVFVLTSLISFCPLYPIFKINTNKKK